MGGSDKPSNIVSLTVEEHAEAHRVLFEEYGRWEDELAWKGLSRMIDKEEIIHRQIIEAGKIGNAIHSQKLKDDPEYYEKWCNSNRKPKSVTENYFYPKSEEAKVNMRKSALSRPRIPCSKCGKGITNANLKKHERACNE